MTALPAVSAVGAVRAVAAQARAAGQPAAQAEPAVQADLTRTNLSDTGRLLQALAQPAGTAAGAGSASASGNGAATLPPSVPLLAAPPLAGTAATTALAGALQQSLADSGLFYESHLAEWVGGQRPLEALRQEPQGALPPLTPPPPDTGQAAAPVPAGADPRQSASAQATMLPPLGPQDRPLPAGATAAAGVPASGPAPASAAVSAAGSAPVGIVHPLAAPLVQQQLQALDQQGVAWTVQAWPGQTVQLSARPDEELPDAARRQGKSASPAAGVPWTSTLRLTLPGLGTVDAQLQLHGQQIGIRLDAAGDQVPALRSGLPALAQALQDSGLLAIRLDVQASPSAPADHAG